MEPYIIEGQKFEKINFANNALPAKEFEECSFHYCDFSNVNLSSILFTNCIFFGCQFNLTTLKNTGFRGVKFDQTKIMGLQFEDCNQFLLSLAFSKSSLTLSSFRSLVLKKIEFSECILKEVDFSSADLSGSSFQNTALSRSIFFQTNLEKADFTSAIDYAIDPDLNKVKRTKFSFPGLLGLLDKYDLDIRE